MKKALFIVPDLEVNGAQTMLFELLKIFQKEYFIHLISPTDGVYKEYYNKLGYEVEIREQVAASDDYRRYLQTAYDLVFLNSSSVAPYIYFFINVSVNVIWWLHETSNQLVRQSNMINPVLLSANIHILGATIAVKEGIWQTYGCDIDDSGC